MRVTAFCLGRTQTRAYHPRAHYYTASGPSLRLPVAQRSPRLCQEIALTGRSGLLLCAAVQTRQTAPVKYAKIKVISIIFIV